MSIYSGFSTRQQETVYNKAIFGVVTLLSLRISKLFKGGKKKGFLS